MSDMRETVRRLIAARYPEAAIERIEPMRPDAGEAAGETEKAVGYGEPVRVVIRDEHGLHQLVIHTATPNRYGHDHRADRAREMLLSYDTFGHIPRHVAALDVGAIRERDGAPISLRGCGELYLVTEWVPGMVYAEDLRRIARDGQASHQDRTRAVALADYLAALHQPIPGAEPRLYTRAIRDLVGDGEGIYGLVDGYPDDVPAAPPSRLRAIEERCASWRWRTRGREARLVRTHGDFHPFNILFDERGQLSLLDASRGCAGDAADDVTCLALNYAFFALEEPRDHRAGLGALWDAFWRHYLQRRADRPLLEIAPPYFAWRALVVCNPDWYPGVNAGVRDALLRVVEGALDAGALDLRAVEALFE